MKKLVVILLTVLCVSAYGQSESVEEFRQSNRPDNKLVFYKSTLRMFARLSVQFAEDQKDMPDLGKLIDGIEKIKFFSYRPSSDLDDLAGRLKTDIIGENYESVISGKFGANEMEVLMKEKKGNPVAFVVIVRGDEGLQLMDIEGVPDLNNLVEFSQYVSTNGDSFSLLDAFR
ncbi:MAG: DUF4252 domain-containing protein [Roseivirga sp.]|nr:DUF4252 domain-containing protein [Roseivirga sp.]